MNAERAHLDEVDTGESSDRSDSGLADLRMVVWKHYVILFGGFIDVGVKSEQFPQDN